MARLGLRQRVLEKVFGGGASGLVAASALGWLVDQLREARHGAQVLDTSRLVPGETYTVRTRPPMDRTERRLALRYEKARTALDAANRPSARQRRVALDLAKAQRRADKRPDDAGRAERAEQIGRRFDALMAPTPKQRRLTDEVTRLEHELDRRRAEALRTQRRRRRPPMSKRFL